MNTDKTSATYPYERVVNAAWMKDVQEIPKRIMDYLLDLPLPGYAPPDDNSYPRCRLAKYLYYDGPEPLKNKLPTPGEKLKLVFDPMNPDKAPSDKGYRVFPVMYVPQAQVVGQTVLRCYIGNVKPTNTNLVEVSIVLNVMCNMQMDTNAGGKVMSRVMAMEQCLWEALNGVNIGGVGVIYCDRYQLSGAGSESVYDTSQNVGRQIIFGVTYAESGLPPHTAEV